VGGSVAIYAARRAVPQVEVPSRYRVPTKGQRLIDVEGRTVRECIEAVEAQYPGFLELVFDEKGDLNRFVRLFVNGDEVARDAPDAPVGDGDRVQILAAVAGG
jgi:molybdopterin synthase sulfur carrier subunit